ncbi:MAG: hypothetical protein II864_01440 [Prevotella sp.]|nr:hypothetical protein [Prevotella sp.]MBQ3752193.1 hypothetical protein [Prevotella sp.]
MTALELRTSIANDMNLMDEAMLQKMSSYGKRLLSHTRQKVNPLFDTPTKVEIDDDIKRMMGRFPIPADFNEKAFVGEARLKDYLAL